jgi:hypothetical protein
LETSRRFLSDRNAKIKLTRGFEACQENGQVGGGQFVTSSFIRLASSEKLYYAGSVAGGVFPPHPLSRERSPHGARQKVVPVAIQILTKEG